MTDEINVYFSVAGKQHNVMCIQFR